MYHSPIMFDERLCSIEEIRDEFVPVPMVHGIKRRDNELHYEFKRTDSEISSGTKAPA
jgi:hypothetical protein